MGGSHTLMVALCLRCRLLNIFKLRKMHIPTGICYLMNSVFCPDGPLVWLADARSDEACHPVQKHSDLLRPYRLPGS